MAHSEQPIPPQRWPAEITYLTSYTWSPSVPYDVKYNCSFPSADFETKIVDRRSPPPVEIRAITDVRHPAYGQLGLFATEKIPPFTWILDYLGHISLTELIPADRTYTLQFFGPLSVDASEYGNAARCINDWIGIARRPNACFDTYRDAEMQSLRVGVWSLNQWIEVDDEILSVYGSGFWKDKDPRRRWNPEWDAWEDSTRNCGAD
ncbi:hypothetical protein HDU89_005307 [Geranomyces variabilis]|nr:hypothetical protein HDU89_005307 [Geranomyces variabilis]